MKDTNPKRHTGAIAQFLQALDPDFQKILLLPELVIWGDYIVALTASPDLRDVLVCERCRFDAIARRLGYKFTAAILPTELHHWKKARKWRISKAKQKPFC
jgi:hypothetical protein